MKTSNSEKQDENIRPSAPNSLTAFDAAMRKIVSVPKEEVKRREQAERDAKSAKK